MELTSDIIKKYISRKTAGVDGNKKAVELKPSDIVKMYGFETLAEVSRKSKISAKTLAKWSRTDGHRRRFHLVLKGLILEEYSDWLLGKASWLKYADDERDEITSDKEVYKNVHSQIKPSPQWIAMDKLLRNG